jgi:hypothetical protein
MNPTLNLIKVDIRIEEIKLPPCDEILVLGKNSPHGKMGILKSFELFAPNGFDLIEVDHELVEAVFINKRISKKISAEFVLKMLRDRVFPYISEGELLKVDFKVTLIQNLAQEIKEN